MAQIDVAPNGNYVHHAEAYVTGYNVGGGYATVHYRYWIDRIISAGSASFLLSGGKLFRETVDGANHDAVLTYDWRAYSSRTMIEGDRNVSMSGYRTIGFGLYFEGHSSSFPAASGSGSLGIAWVPVAPSPVGIDEILPTSLRYRFSGNSDNGSGITGWTAQIATNSAFTTGVQTVSSGGTTTFTGLTPGTTYYCRSLGTNGVGTSAWSSVISAQTLSGGRAWDGTAWRNCKVRTWDGSQWRFVRVRYWDGTAWRNTK